MKTFFKLISGFTLLLFTTSVFATVSYNKHPFKTNHINTIKGLIYEMAKNPSMLKQEIRMKFLPVFAKALVWVDKAHNDKKKVYEIADSSADDKQVLQAVVQHIVFIAEGANGTVTEEDANRMLTKWHDLGSNVVATYSEKKVYNPSTKKYDKKVTYSIKLKKKKKNLLLKENIRQLKKYELFYHPKRII